VKDTLQEGYSSAFYLGRVCQVPPIGRKREGIPLYVGFGVLLCVRMGSRVHTQGKTSDLVSVMAEKKGVGCDQL
jgi:hypothetical protein